MLKKILILFGALFLTIFLINTVSAENSCWFETNSANCMSTNGGQVVMSLSASTNAHGALKDQGAFTGVLCCNFGAGDTPTCNIDNKIIGLSSSTNAHADVPDIVPSTYTNDVCYDSLHSCSTIDSITSCAVDEIEVLYLSSDTTNAHIEVANLGDSQNYESKICCVVETPPAECDLTTAEWQYAEVMEETNVETIVNGTGCDGWEISFEVFRGATSCNSITGCENPGTVTFGSGSNSVTGTWNASPHHDNEYRFVAEVVTTGETVPSSTPDLLVIAECPYDPEPVICSDYTNENDCNSNLCTLDIQDSVPNDIDCNGSDINCWCIWEDNECKAGWDGSGCGDGVINLGEQCDGTTWSPITGCSDFDVFTGGDLSCVDCQFNTTLCTGGIDIGYCGDDVINPGETCDGSDWWPITNCSDFDAFTGGILMCTDCQFDTSQCVGGPIGSEIGICVYTQFTEDDCDDGSLTFNWTAKWTWDIGCDILSGCQTEAGNLVLAAECQDGWQKAICPAQIPLPFFNMYSFIATLSIIALIYVILILRKEKRKR